jgi:glutamate-1-semialdehyde aminotransferase
MFDITNEAVASTAPIHIKSAAGDYLYDADGKPCEIVVYGPGSRQFGEVEARQTNRAVKRMQDNDGKVALASPEQRAKEQAEDLAAITAEFRNFTYPPAKGKSGTELFEQFYLDRSLGFIHQQVLKALGDWGKFKTGSAIS